MVKGEEAATPETVYETRKKVGQIIKRGEAAIPRLEVAARMILGFRDGCRVGVPYFDVIVMPGWRIFNLCNAMTRDGRAKICGNYYAAKLWGQSRWSSNSKWCLYDGLSWNVLDALKDCVPGQCRRWVDNLNEHYGTKANRPQIGRDTKFAPWYHGPSMIVELLLPDGSWGHSYARGPQQGWWTQSSQIDQLSMKQLEGCS